MPNADTPAIPQAPTMPAGIANSAGTLQPIPNISGEELEAQGRELDKVLTTRSLPSHPGIFVGRSSGLGARAASMSNYEFADHITNVRQAMTLLASPTGSTDQPSVGHQLLEGISSYYQSSGNRNGVIIHNGASSEAQTTSSLDAGRPGVGSGSSIYIKQLGDMQGWDLANERGTMHPGGQDVAGERYMKPLAVFGHELVHAYANQRGLREDAWLGLVSELKTVGLLPGYDFTENMLRKDLGYEERQAYNNVTRAQLEEMMQSVRGGSANVTQPNNTIVNHYAQPDHEVRNVLPRNGETTEQPAFSQFVQVSQGAQQQVSLTAGPSLPAGYRLPTPISTTEAAVREQVPKRI